MGGIFNGNRKKIFNKKLPDNLTSYKARKIEQAYLCTDPVVRVRRDNDVYYLTYKSKGMIVREEYNLPLTKEAYRHLLAKADGNIITKTRYEIPEKIILPLSLMFLRENSTDFYLLKLSLLPKKKLLVIFRLNGSERM